MTVLFLAMLALSQGVPIKPVEKKASLASISPPIHTGSDKKFFGPPFPANYPEDTRPIHGKDEKRVMDQLRGPDQPYPALQSKDDYDKDYVKDENSDKGSWKAQFDYDYLRKKMAQEKDENGKATDSARKAQRELDEAKRKADAAGKDADDAKKGVDDASHGEDETDKDENLSGPPSAEKLEQLKKAVADAEASYEKEKKDFAECEKQLEDAKTNLAELKAKQVELENQLASETKLWLEHKTQRFNVKKSKEDVAHTKVTAAHERLREAQVAKADMDAILAGKKAQHDVAKKSAAKEKAEVEKMKKDLAKATLTLQKLRGYTPPAATPKSSASMASVLLSVALLAIHVL